MMHPHTELRFINATIGHGVVATRFIPRGTVTWVRDPLDQTFTRDQLGALHPSYRATMDKYTFVDALGHHVLCWDLARYMNHSCAPTCLSAGYDFEVAVRDVLPGEELTDDYGTLNLTEPFACACGVAGCRGTITGDDFDRRGDGWDAQVRDAFSDLRRIEQPLWPLVERLDGHARLLAALGGMTPIASCRDNDARRPR
jgi:hypothetical protein